MVKTYAEMRFSIIFILSLAAVLVQGCQYGGTVDCRLVEADSLMASKPGKSLEILEGIDGNRLGKRERAYYALLLSQARYRNYIEFTDDSLITEAVRYYEASGDRRNLAYAYLYAGCIAGELGDDEKDLSLTQKAAKAAEGTEDYWLLTYLYYHWGGLLAGNKPYEMATYYFEKSKKYAELAGNSRYVSNNWNELSGIELLLRNFKKAEAFADSAIAVANAAGLKSRLPVNYHLLALILTFEKNYDKALQSINKALEYEEYDPNLYASYACKGEILLYVNSLDSAEYYIKRSKNNDSYYSRADYENLMSKLEEKRGNYRQSLIHCRNYARLLDTIKIEEDSSRITAMQRRYDYARVERDRNELELESQRKTIVILLMAFAAACCAVVMTIYISQRRKRNSQRLLAKERLLAQANAEIADKTTQLVAERQQKSEIGQRIQQGREEMRKINELESKDGGKAVKLSREDIYDLALILNQTNDNFAERLRKKHPDLSDNDYGLCLITKLGINNKGMSLLLDTTESAIRKRKSRLKNDRLQADGFETLEEYIESI